MDADGDFVVVWMSAGGVFAQRYDALGNASGPEFQVDAVTPSGALFPAVAMDADGDFVVAWNKYGQDGSYNGVYARRFSAAGSPDGDEFRVNTFTTGDQDFPAVAMDPAGNTVITWESSGQDGSGSGIYAQRYNAAGAPQGGEFRVNFTTSAGQAAPSVSMDLDGDFMVAWSSTDFSGSYGIFAQAYNSAGAVQVPEFRANTFSTGNQHLASVALDHEGDVVVVWQSGGQDGSGEGIFGQQYDESPDTAPPAVSDVLAIGQPVSSGERILQNPSTLSLLFTEAMSTTGGSSGANSVTNPANYTLMRNGVVVSSLIASVTFGLNDRKHEAVLNMTEPLLDGNYVLTASQALHDVAGNPLDGDGNGVLGGDFARSFGIFGRGPLGREFRVNTLT